MNNKFEIGKETAIKYVMFKKRTEFEVRKKLEFLNYNNNVIDSIMEYLKETEYIDDNRYIKKYFDELKNIKNWSKKQVKNDLYKRGFKGNINEEELNDYELKSILNLYERYECKYPNSGNEELQNFINALLKKGFEYDNVKKIIKEK